MSLNGKTEIKMWKHFCTVNKEVLGVESGSPCNWCNAEEEVEMLYQGLYWCYPLQEYKRWPEYMEYYYWLDKKSS